jgi:hypothetical protein
MGDDGLGTAHADAQGVSFDNVCTSIGACGPAHFDWAGRQL